MQEDYMKLMCNYCKKPIITGQGWSHTVDGNKDYHIYCLRKLTKGGEKK